MMQSAARAQRIKTKRQQLLETARGPRLPKDVGYLLLTSLASTAKPWGFLSVAALARSIHRRRQNLPLYLETAWITPWMSDVQRCFVSLYTREFDGASQRFLGWAYLNGGDWRVLRDALLAEQPESGPRSEPGR